MVKTERVHATEGPNCVFYLWYGNARMWDFALGWIPKYPKSGAKEDLRTRRLARSSCGDPSLVETLIKMKGYERCADEN
jgi:hypothetical protein